MGVGVRQNFQMLDRLKHYRTRGFRAMSEREALVVEAGYRVTINRIQYNPPGKDDPSQLNAEYVVLENMGGGRVSLEGWTLLDNTTTGQRRHGYKFPEKVSLLPREQVYIFTGSGRDSFVKGTPPRWNLYWGRQSFVWNNEGDKATLLDAEGRSVDSLQVVPLKAD